MRLVAHDEEDKDEKSEANKGESKDQTSTEGDLEGAIEAVTRFLSCSNIGTDGNLHANIARQNRGQSSKEEWNRSVRHHGLLLRSEENDNAEKDDEDECVSVLFFEEG